MHDPIVLFVEDSALSSLATSEILRDNGFDVVEARSAEDAMTVIGAGETLLALVTDIDLGDGDDGFEVARRARATNPRLPVVFVSGQVDARQRALRVKGAEFVPKPFRRQRIVEALNRVIGKRAA